MTLDLYRHYDADGNLLYIGITVRGERRMREHARDAKWWEQVANTTYQRGFTDLGELLAAEEEAIRNEHPKHNKTYNSRIPVHLAKITKGITADEQLLIAYLVFVKTIGVGGGVPSGKFAEWIHRDGNPYNLTKEQFQEFAIRVLGPTTVFDENGNIKRGWTGDAHALNLAKGRSLLDYDR